MQFQIILWEFNCKSNKNIKSYYMLYENIVSNLLMFLKKYSSRLHLIGREMPACHSVALPIRHKHPLLFSAVTSGRLTVRCAAYRVCLHSSQQHIKLKELQRSLQKYISCSQGSGVGAGRWRCWVLVPVGFQGTSRGSLVVPSQPPHCWEQTHRLHTGLAFCRQP